MLSTVIKKVWVFYYFGSVLRLLHLCERNFVLRIIQTFSITAEINIVIIFCI